MATRLTHRNEWKFFSVLLKADRPLALVWWAMVAVRGVLPAVFPIVMGVLVGAVQHGDRLSGPLISVAVVFLLAQVLPPIHQAAGANLGDRHARPADGQRRAVRGAVYHSSGRLPVAGFPNSAGPGARCRIRRVLWCERDR